MKGVSPLIATIILIAVTIGIGAVIVSFARSYVQTQVNVVGVEFSIIGHTYDKNSNSLNLTVQNVGQYALSNFNQLRVLIQTTDGKTYSCPYYNTTLSNAPTITKSVGANCIVYSVYNISSSTYLNSINPSDFAKFLIYIENISLIGSNVYIEINNKISSNSYTILG